MHRVQRTGELHHQRKRIIGWHCAASGNVLVHGLALEGFHDQVRLTIVGNAALVKLDHVGVLHAGKVACLLEELFSEQGVLSARSDEPLDGHLATVALVLGKVDVGHCSLADGIQDSVMVTDDLADGRVAVHRKYRCSDAISDNGQLCGTLGPHELSGQFRLFDESLC
jgi:hypothetical protein